MFSKLHQDISTVYVVYTYVSCVYSYVCVFSALCVILVYMGIPICVYYTVCVCAHFPNNGVQACATMASFSVGSVDKTQVLTLATMRLSLKPFQDKHWHLLA